MQRNNAIDLTRAVAMLVIVTCHFLSFKGIEGVAYIGHYLGYVGNFIFFAVSALLFGMQYEKMGVQPFEPNLFMKKRLVRLFASLWPYLIVVLTIYYFCGVHLNPIKVAMNFVGMGWFGKLPDIGHLWFVTMIIFCYCMYVVYSKWLTTKQIGGGIWAIVLVVSVLLQTILDYRHLPGTLFIILFYSLWIFKNSSYLLECIESCKWYILIPFAIVVNGTAVYACFYSDSLGTTLVHWTGYLAGATLFFVLMKFGRNVKCGKSVMFLSLTGYEIYLVHHGLCCGTLSVIHVTDYAVVNYVILWLASIFFGWILKQVGDTINSKIMKKI